MPFDPVLAAIRFGTGLSPGIAPPGSAAEMMAALRGPDRAAGHWPIPTYASLIPGIAEYLDLERAANAGPREARAEAGERLDVLREEKRLAHLAAFRATVARMVSAEDALRERLALFWADHFTVVGKSVDWWPHVSHYVEEAIRPHVAGRFGEMLLAVTTHPMMLIYLDQNRSIGPDSPVGMGRERGLNENLARELLELHTLGVQGPYGQDDVRELAELLTGLTVARGAMAFRPGWAQPGAETVLGQGYPRGASLDAIQAVLEDLAAHPATAAHVGRKLAVHFVADEPEQALVDELAGVFLETGGDLGAVTEALLGHDAAWAPERRKVRQPVEFLAASLRALGMGGDWVAGLDLRETHQVLLGPLSAMGQAWQRPSGPDGWPEEAEAWVTPHGVAGRIDWAMTRPVRIRPDLPDPRDFVVTALGPAASEAVTFAAHAAESPAEGVGLVLASAEFQRR